MTRKISLLLALSLLLAVSCWRRQKTGEAPKLPQPPKTGAKASTGYQGLDRYGFFFVIFTETGRHFVQLSEWVDKEPAEVPKEKIQIAQIVPTLVLLHSPEAAIFPELEGREYVVMRNHEPICRGKMEAPLLVGQQVPGSHEWNEWDVEPWDNPRPQLEEVAKKVPLSEMWKKSYVFSGGPLSSCTVARKDGDYDKVFWARPADLPSPSLLSQDISKEMYQQLHEEAVRRLKVGGFSEKLRQYREDMGADDIEPNIDVSIWTDAQSVFVEIRASAGEEECGGSANQTWIVWKVTNLQWEEVAREDKLRNIALIGDLNEDGKYEIVIREYSDVGFIVTLYQLEGLYLKKVMRMEYPSYEAAC